MKWSLGVMYNQPLGGCMETKLMSMRKSVHSLLNYKVISVWNCEHTHCMSPNSPVALSACSNQVESQTEVVKNIQSTCSYTNFVHVWCLKASFSPPSPRHTTPFALLQVTRCDWASFTFAHSTGGPARRDQKVASLDDIQCICTCI